MALLMSSDTVVKNVNLLGERMVRLSCVKEDQFVEGMPNVNVCVVAFTTSYARLELYKWLEKLQDRCLYFDTGMFLHLKC